MPDLSSKKFASVFARALEGSGRLTKNDLRALKDAQASITAPKEKAAAESIMALLRNDAELDSFELDPVRKALGVLTGVSRGPLPPDLEAVLKNAVPSANVNVKHYDLTFDLTGKRDAFPARAIVALDAKAPAVAVLEANPERLTVSRVLVEGKAVPFEQKDGRLFITAPGAKALQVEYTVKPDDTVDPNAFGLIRDKYTGRMWTMTWPYNTGALFPSSSNPADGATASVVVKVAAGIEAVATGTKTPKGAFVSSAEAPSYAIAFYAAPDFELGNAGHSHGGVEVSSFGNGKKIPEANRKAYAEAAKASLTFYESWLGKYDYGPTLKLVEVPGGLGGMEHTAAVAIMMNAARNVEAAKETAAHEVAHHWFGDNVRIKNWGDFWMSEGFTNYATFRYFRHAEGEDKFRDLLRNAREEITDALRHTPHALSAPAHTDVHEIFTALPYQLGPWLLRMMEAELGTPKLDALLKDWFQTNRQKAVSTDDFVAFAKKKTGHDFGPFFAEWNTITAVPKLEALSKVKGNVVEAQLNARNEYPKGLKVPLELSGPAGTKTVMVSPGAPVKIDAGFPVQGVRWDPEMTVLAYLHTIAGPPKATRDWATT
ncbi:MAG: hypothetical protein JNK82_41040 [Myxococcaceae bacterium]|nr:hypothetical protein [Myxococcaceae bacterium]